MKSLVELCKILLLDCGRVCGAPVHKSVLTLLRRVEHEGDSFLTIALPAFCQDFERALDSGRIDPGSFPNFRKKKGTAGIPAFLSEFLFCVFDAEGSLLDEPSIDCIRAIRQICLFCKKVSRPCSKDRELNAIDNYIQCDLEVIETLPETQLSRYFKKVASIIIDDLSLEEISIGDLRPKHGPGATREGIFGNQKYRHKVWHERLEAVGFSRLLFAHGSDTISKEELAPDVLPVLIEPGNEEPVKVTLVPKTLKTPRVIAIEPVCMQYVQQALMAPLVDRVETGLFTGGHVCFTDQGINMRKALSASKSGFYATLDMKDASDRVSMAHTIGMFAEAPTFLGRMLACRSTRAQLPNGEVISLSKFASMGSALCFPVEALVFFTTIIASRICRAGLFPTRSTVISYSRDVYVFGDDLIIPADEAPATCDDLESFGFKVNRRKSFWTGKFRESCGADCYDGQKVTPVYLRSDIPARRGDVSRILSSVATANQLFNAGYYRTALAIRDCVDDLLDKLPEVPEDSPAIGWLGYSEASPIVRWNSDLQRAEMLCWVPSVRKRPDPLQDQPAMVKCLLTGGRKMVVSAEDHLSKSPSRSGLTLKRKWVPVAH